MSVPIEAIVDGGLTMPTERKVWAAVTLLIATATAFYMGVVVGAHTMAGKRVVLQQTAPLNEVHCADGYCWTGNIRPTGPLVGPHENDGYGVDR